MRRLEIQHGGKDGYGEYQHEPLEIVIAQPPGEVQHQDSDRYHVVQQKQHRIASMGANGRKAGILTPIVGQGIRQAAEARTGCGERTARAFSDAMAARMAS